MTLAAARFAPWIPELVNQEQTPDFSIQASLTKDEEGYKLGPHSDAPDRVLTMMYYLPRSEGISDAGTVLYKPNDESFECAGGPWHEFEDFVEVKRIPYKPNTLFGFVKTRTSFHGVPPLNSISVDRDILHITVHFESRIP